MAFSAVARAPDPDPCEVGSAGKTWPAGSLTPTRGARSARGTEAGELLDVAPPKGGTRVGSARSF